MSRSGRFILWGGGFGGLLDCSVFDKSIFDRGVAIFQRGQQSRENDQMFKADVFLAADLELLAQHLLGDAVGDELLDCLGAAIRERLEVTHDRLAGALVKRVPERL